jgi:four helix bundle protein
MEEFGFVVEERSSAYNIKHRAFYFSRDIIHFVAKQQIDRIFSSLFDQLIRSATSIGANLVEGIAGSSRNDFIKYHIIALKSANETKYWLSLIKESLVVDKIQITELINEANEIANITGSIVINTKKNSL